MEQNDKEEILEAISTFADAIEERFEIIDKRFDTMEKRFEEAKVYIDTRLTQTETRMVTKDYLDDKLADLEGNLHVLLRREDTKLVALVHVLRERKVIEEMDAKKILGMDLFPQTI